MINMASQKRKTIGKINKQREIEMKKRKKRKAMFTVILIIIAIAGIGAYLLTSTNFSIQEISIKGNEQLSAENIYEIAKVKRGDNIFSKIGIVMKVRLKEN